MSDTNNELKNFLWKIGAWDNLTHDQHIKLNDFIKANYIEKSKVLEAIGDDLGEGEGWEWWFSNKARCCPGDDFAYFGTHLKKQVRKSLNLKGKKE